MTAAAQSLSPDAMDALLDAWARMTVVQLRAVWCTRWGSEPPPIQSPDLLARLMSWRVQAAAEPAPGRLFTRRLAYFERQIAAGRPVSPRSGRLPPGSHLTRTWRGERHTVTVLETGFLHGAQRYATLSEVARAITGTRWSGPRFFGLEDPAPGSAAPVATPEAEPPMSRRMTAVDA